VQFHLHRYPYLSVSPQYHKLISILEKGIAYHHSGLLPLLKEIVEILFSKGFVKVLFATETFAVGINMPTKTVVFTSYQKHDGNTLRMLRTSEYIQMAGRAGRRGKDTLGHVLYLPDREPSPLEDVRRMMTGGSARISSQMDFGYDFLIRTFYGKDLNWKEIARNTYWYQQRQEGIADMQRDLLDLTVRRDVLPLSPDIVDELQVRVDLENRIRENTNAKRKQAQRELELWKNAHTGYRWDLACKAFSEWKTYDTEITNITREIANAANFEQEIEPRLEFLRQHKFLEEPMGKYASIIHEGHPLLMAYAFHHKLFHHLPLDQLMGCLVLFCGDGEEFSLNDCSQLTPESVECIEQLKNQMKVLNLDDLKYYWVDVAIRWVRGESSGAICADYQLYEGNFIRAMLKLANIADEWITLSTMSSDLTQLEITRGIRQTIVRDSVVPDSLYLRI